MADKWDELIRLRAQCQDNHPRAHEPEGVSAMEWGSWTAIDNYRKLHNRVLNVVYDLGAVGETVNRIKGVLPETWLEGTAGGY